MSSESEARALLQAGQTERAVAAYQQVLAGAPGWAAGHNDLGVALQTLGHTQDAGQAYRRAMDLDPDDPGPLFNLGNLMLVMDFVDEAAVLLNRLVKRWPDYDDAYLPLAQALMQLCAWSNLSAVVDRALAALRQGLEGEEAFNVAPFSLNSLPCREDVLAAAVARRVSTDVARAAGPASFSHDWPRPERLRLGYISPDLRTHSIGQALAELLAAHDRERFEVFGYALTRAEAGDALAQLLAQRFEHMRDLSALDDRSAAEAINQDRIDVLIDLAGHTRGARLGILALKPAPVQAHFLGFGDSLGADFLPYLFSDARYCPPERQRHWPETLVMLPENSLPAPRPEIAPPPSRAEEGLPETAFVFANFGWHYKFDPGMFSAWMRVLKKTPGSLLWLLDGVDTAKANLIREAELRGVAGERLVFATFRPQAEHLARQGLADLVLDTRYQSGGVSTLEALWAGVPVLAAVGLAELIADDLDAFQRLAIDLAVDTGRLNELRARLAANRLSQPLFDSQRFARHFEAGIELMLDCERRGTPDRRPRCLEVPALPAPTSAGEAP
jgi:predicted O-linked N-acetylglucosamine transferase (SPINDLY family)